MRTLRFALAVAALALLLAPAATAHTSVFSADGKLRVVVGQLNEPVVTYAKSGLDVCFQANTTARTPVAGVNPGAITVSLIAPSGARLTQPLAAQFGRTGCFQFQDPYVLTEAGQYTADLQGTVNGTAFSFTRVIAGGAVDNVTAVTFPATSVMTNEHLTKAKADKAELEGLRTRVQQLEADKAALENRVKALEQARATGTGTAKESPMPVALLVLGLLAALAVARRRSA